MPIRLHDLAARLEGRVEGDEELIVQGVRPLAEAAAEHLSLWNHPRYRSAALESAAGALLTTSVLAEQLGPDHGRNLLLVDDVSFALARALELLHPERERAPGIAPSAILDPSVEVDPSAWIGPYVVIEAGSKIGARAAIHPFVSIGRGCSVGEGAILYPHAVLYDDSEIGPGGIVHAGAVIGSDGFGYATRQGVHHKVPQVGRAVVEAEVEIGANSTIDRATLGETRIGRGAKVDNLVQVGHNVKVGAGSILCGQAGIAGSTELGRYVVLAGQVGVSGHLSVADGTQVAAKSAVLRPVEEKGGQIGGIPARPIADWRREAAATTKLPQTIRRQNELARRVERIEERLAALGEPGGPGDRGEA